MKLKYELKIDRIIFGTDRHPSDFDRFEFEQLIDEVKAENRFVLVASDGTRFCAHNDRLSFASEVFKAAFEFRNNQENIEKQNEDMKMPDLSGQGLKEVN